MTLKTVNLICAGISIIFLIISLFLPETPVFLIEQQKIDEAKKSLKFFRKNDQNIQEELYELQAMKSSNKKSLLIELKNESTRKAFVIIIAMLIFFQTCGINAVMFYLTTILIDSEMSSDPFLSTVVLGALQILASFLAMALVDRKGRKFLLIASFLVMGFGLLSNAIYFHLKFNGMNFVNFNWIPFVAILIYLIGFNAGLATVTFVLLGEIFSTTAKKIVAPLALMACFVSSFIVTLVFPLLSETFGMHVMFYFFTISCVIGVVFTLKIIPETKGKSLLEIQKLLGNAREINVNF